MSHATAFLVLYPHLAELEEAGERHWENLTNYTTNVRLRDRFPFPLPAGPLCHAFAQYDPYRPGFERFQRALNDEYVRRLEVVFLDELDESVRLLTEGQTLDDFELADQYLGDGITWLHQFIKDLAVTAFGEWGANFFQAAIEEVGLDMLKKRYLFMEFDTAAAEQGIPALVGSAVPDPLVLDEQTFAVRWGERGPCVLGNTKSFHLLRVLAESPNKYLSFIEIAERMGGGELDADNLPVVKHRLCEKLRREGFAALTWCIEAQPLHYGLFLRYAQSK
jgi:hypothetical protein